MRHLCSACCLLLTDQTDRFVRIVFLLTYLLSLGRHLKPYMRSAGTQVRTILSQNTTDTNSSRAFAGLKAAFPEWEAVRTAPEGAAEESVRCGGLADIKVARIKVCRMPQICILRRVPGRWRQTIWAVRRAASSWAARPPLPKNLLPDKMRRILRLGMPQVSNPAPLTRLSPLSCR